METKISLAPEILFHIGSFPVSNSFFWMLFITLVLIVFFVLTARKMKVIPSLWQNMLEIILDGGLKFVSGVIGDERKAKKIFPLIFTFFIFILFSNLFNFFPLQFTLFLKEGHEKIPIFRAVMADYGLVLVMTLIAFFAIQIIGIIESGLVSYLGKFFNFKSPIKFFLGIIELVSEVSKIISLSFRLFGNIFAGEVLLTIILFLLPFVGPLPFMLLELMAAFIQAFIFSALVLIFISLSSHHAEGEEGRA